MVRIMCSSETCGYFADVVSGVALKVGDNFCGGCVAKIIGDCAFVPFENFLEIYEEGEWKYDNDGSN